MSNPSLQPADAMPGESPQLLYIDIDGSRYDILEEEIIPRQMENGVIVICLEGEAEVILDLKTYLIKRGDLCIIFPFTIIQVVRRSSNFKGYAMGLSVEFISNIQVKSDMAYYLYIKENPCISLSEEEQRMLLELCDMIAKKSLRQDYPFRQEIIDKLLMALCYEIVAIFEKGEPIIQETRSRQDIIFRRFLFSLTTNYKTERDVKFYAQEQFITPRYLSSVIKEISGAGASQWISRIVIRHAKSLLISTQMTMKQITDELHFANPSFFSQYFKKYTGMTPKTFRETSK